MGLFLRLISIIVPLLSQREGVPCMCVICMFIVVLLLLLLLKREVLAGRRPFVYSQWHSSDCEYPLFPATLSVAVDFEGWCASVEYVEMCLVGSVNGYFDFVSSYCDIFYLP